MKAFLGYEVFGDRTIRDIAIDYAIAISVGLVFVLPVVFCTS